jgi:hypothetical protein
MALAEPVPHGTNRLDGKLANPYFWPMYSRLSCKIQACSVIVNFAANENYHRNNVAQKCTKCSPSHSTLCYYVWRLHIVIVHFCMPRPKWLMTIGRSQKSWK